MTDTIALIVGLVVGVGIFKTPSLVAANTGGNGLFFLVWLVGGLVSLTGVLCYAELTTTYPHAGGDYYYLSRAFGRKVGFLFAWARMTIIQPGSIAMLAFVFGDYMAQLWPAGQHSPFLVCGSCNRDVNGAEFTGNPERHTNPESTNSRQGAGAIVHRYCWNHVDYPFIATHLFRSASGSGFWPGHDLRSFKLRGLERGGLYFSGDL